PRSAAVSPSHWKLSIARCEVARYRDRRPAECAPLVAGIAARGARLNMPAERQNTSDHAPKRGPQGQWLPGSSPNPGGRPKIIEDIRDLARAHTGTAINAHVHIAESGKQESARVAAASALLDRGCGKPTQPLSGDKDAPPIGLSIEDQRREISERHERSRRRLDEVFNGMVTTQKPGARDADR